MFRFRDNGRGLKTAFLINMIMYCVFSVVIMNYVAALSNIVVAVTTAVSLIRGKRERQDGEEGNDGKKPADA